MNVPDEIRLAEFVTWLEQVAAHARAELLSDVQEAGDKLLAAYTALRLVSQFVAQRSASGDRS